MSKVIITDENFHEYTIPIIGVNNERKAKGLIPRDYNIYPHGSLMHAKPFDLPLIDRKEMADRANELIKNGATLLDIRNNQYGKPIPSRDQNGKGFCHTPDTEVLTEDGFVRWDEYNWKNKLATMNLNSARLEYQSPFEKHIYKYDGPIIRPIGSYKKIDFAVTPDHRMLIMKWDYDKNNFSTNFSFVKAEELLKIEEPFQLITDYDQSIYGTAYNTVICNKDIFRKEEYKGNVYCAAVPNRNLITSYNNRSLISGNCWAHSSTSACLLLRALNNEPYADLSAYAVACMIKNFRDQGGWGAESLEFIADKGIPTSKTWPQQSMSRSNDNNNTWEEAAHNKVTEWMDLDPAQMLDQFLTCLLTNIPVVSDYNWWGHSVCAIRVTKIVWNSNYTKLVDIAGDIWNSWGDSWSENGVGELQGRKFIPDSAIAPRVMLAA